MQPDADTASNLAMFTQEGYKKPQRPQFLLGNHTSFMDSILLSRILPRNIAFRLRAYVASHVARLPLFGTLMRASGHFIVPYSSEQYDSFELNTALMAQTQEVVTEHLQNNGNLMFFSRGARERHARLHRKPAAGRLQAGSRIRCSDMDRGVLRNHHTWPKTATIGGGVPRERSL